MYVRELVLSYRRRKVPACSEHRFITSPRHAASVFELIMGEEAVEVFGVLCLTIRQRLIAYHELSRGGLTCTVTSPRELFQVALLSHAATLIVGHNHPSGDPSPSAEDRQLTRRLTEAGALMGVEILDHIIVGHDRRYFSFKEGGGL